MNQRKRLILAVMVAVAAAPAFASGFGFYESVNLTQNWVGTWSYRLGLSFRLDHEMNHELRIGGVIDESPVPADFLRPSIPDADRTGYSLGYGYLSKRWGIDVYAMQLDFDDATANGSPADGVINGTYTSSVLLAGVTAKYRF